MFYMIYLVFFLIVVASTSSLGIGTHMQNKLFYIMVHDKEVGLVYIIFRGRTIKKTIR